ncbi:MAG: SufS family cysteine desulfurase [Planctomycetota bacterium]
MTKEWLDKVRSDFPILQTQMNGKPLIYMDNGATTQKPQAVIDAITHYYQNDNANVHRGLYELSQRATDRYEHARQTVADFIGASTSEECIFVRGTTEAINLVASSWGKLALAAEDEVIVSGLEHHSNIVPWQMACAASGAELKVWYGNADGQLEIEQLGKLLSERTRMIAVQHVSNALGNIHDVLAVVDMAGTVGARVLIDGAQWIGHHETDVLQLGCDFYVFSAHKLFGPTGIGVLWGRKELLEAMPPYQGGGDMIETVAFDKTTYADLPNRFEAGTPDMAGAIGLEAAIEYVQDVGFERIKQQEYELLELATEKLQQVPGLRILGDSERKAAVISFVMESPSIAPMDVASFLANRGIAARTGHHCCMPLMGQLEVSGTTRVSLAFYNTQAEVERLAECLLELVEQRQAQMGDVAKPGDSSEIAFAASAASSVAEAAEELEDEFLDFDDAESKTELLMEIGQGVANHFEALKKISEAVPGCMSEVYLVGRPNPKDASKFEFAADSNAGIVRGLIGVLQQLFSGQKVDEVLGYDLEAFFRRIGLHQFVSTQRRSGLEGMVRRIRTLAQTQAERNAGA